MNLSILGIYKIENIVNNKVYIGQSINIYERWLAHKRDLRNNKHHNYYLQNSYNKYGENNFTFEIIETCKEEVLSEREFYWINSFKSHNKNYGFNMVLPTNNERFSSYLTNKNPVDKGFTNEELISYLEEYYYHYGEVPTQRSISEKFGFPNHKTYHEHFGSFKNALIESGLFEYVSNKYIFERKEYIKEEVLEAFKNFIDTYGRFPDHKELKQTQKFKLPTHNITIKHFGSIHKLREIFGFTKEQLKEKEKQDALVALKKLYEQDGFVTARSIDKSLITKSGKFYRDNFNGMVNACKLAGVPYAEHHYIKQ